MTGIIKVDTIQNNGGTTGLTIDSNGNTSLNNPYGFIYLSSGITLTNNTLTKVTGWTNDGLSGMGWDSTNDEIDITIAGHYFVNFQVNIYSSGNDLRDIIPNVYKNGALNFGAYSFITTTPADVDARHFAFSVSNIMSLAAGDTLSFYIKVQTGGTNPFMHAGDTAAGYRGNNVSVFRVGN